jgi:hypothetical protein
MKTSSNVTNISDFSEQKEIENAWIKVRKIADRIIALHSMMPKSLERTNKHLASSIQELLDAIYAYDDLKGKK